MEFYRLMIMMAAMMSPACCEGLGWDVLFPKQKRMWGSNWDVCRGVPHDFRLIWSCGSTDSPNSGFHLKSFTQARMLDESSCLIAEIRRTSWAPILIIRCRCYCRCHSIRWCLNLQNLVAQLYYVSRPLMRTRQSALVLFSTCGCGQ